MVCCAERLVDLAAQATDVHLDDVRVAVEVVVPHAGEDLGLAQHLAGPAHEELEHVELAGGERDLDVAAPDPARAGVDPQVADRRPGTGSRPAVRRSSARTRATSTGNENGLVR